MQESRRSARLKSDSARGNPARASVTSSPTLFLFDEPTTGLHFDDVRVLLQVFQRLVDAGHSVVVIEHNLDVIKCADWVIDLGPEAGDRGGQIVAIGTPEEVAKCEESHTGTFCRTVLTQQSGDGRGQRADGKSPKRQVCSQLPAPNFQLPISITGAREHNLKNLSLEIPRDQFVVITGRERFGQKHARV